MKTKGTIQIEYQQVINQAAKLEECANDMQELQRQIETLMNNLRSGWSGESAELYLQKCDALAGKLSQSEKNLDQTARVIRKSAKAYRDAELAALELVRD